MDLSRFESLLRSRNPVIRSFLCFGERLYRLGHRVSQARTDAHIRSGRWPHRLPVPVVSIGNIVAGGVGKTPLVEALVRAHREVGGRPGILSRGYRAVDPDGNDEARLLSRRLGDVPHVQNKDRLAGGRRLLQANPDTDLIVLDDGFQHRRLYRDVEVLVVDATRPFGWGRLLPGGYLREPWRGLRRADVIVVTRRAEASRHKLAILDDLFRTFCRSQVVVLAETVIDSARRSDGTVAEVDPGRRVGVFAGIGNPNAFFRTARRIGFEVAGTRIFPDHHLYRPADLTALTEWGMDLRAEALICTEKDGVKLEALPEFSRSKVPIIQLCMHLKVDTDAILNRVQKKTY